MQHSQIAFFTDDTRISKLINGVDDHDLLHLNLEVLHWSENNNMKLHEDKFELLFKLQKNYFRSSHLVLN